MDIYKNFKNSFLSYETKYKSNHWKKFDLRSELFEEKYLPNFRNNSLSDGLDDRYDFEVQKKIFSDLIKKVGEKFVIENLNSNNIGNSEYYFEHKDKVVDAGQNFHIMWLYEIEKIINSQKKIRTVCEIGGGYGSLAQKIIKKYNCKYVSIDLPEANLLSSYYLKSHFPKKTFIGNDQLLDNTLNKDIFEKNEIFILNPWNKLLDIKFDLIINTRSMMEMDKEIIKEYFDLIHKIIDDNGFFLNINRYRKKSVGYPIHFFEYPYDGNWKVECSKSSWKQSWIHFLIVRRNKYNKEKSDIIKELKRIKTKTFYFIIVEKLNDFKKKSKSLIKKIIKLALFIK